MNRLLARLVPGLMVLALAGCGSAPPVPEDHHYRLVRPELPGRLEAPAISGPLLVELPEAVGVRQNRPLLHSRPPHIAFQQYHFHHWEEAPPRMLQRRLRGTLDAAGVADSVVESVRLGDATRLASEIRRFDRLLGPAGPEVIFELAVTLYGPGPERPVLLFETYAEKRKAASESMEDTVVAFSAAVDAVIADLVRDLSRQGSAVTGHETR